MLSFFATTSRGLEPMLAEEMTALGANDPRPVPGGVTFSASMTVAYRACLWSRLANKILYQLKTFPAGTADDVYDATREFPWEEHLSADGTFLVDSSVHQSEIAHSGHAGLRAKDGVADRFREVTGRRPTVRKVRPDIRIHLHLGRSRAVLYLDLSGESLHRRGYRVLGTPAPLKEHLAAAILLRAGWPEVASSGGSLLDPMCGSGTFLVEAALIAADIAPGLFRRYFGFLGWQARDTVSWDRLLAEAASRRDAGLGNVPVILGYDADAKAVSVTRKNAASAGLGDRIQVQQADWSAVPPPAPGAPPGLIVVNPPYGERLGSGQDLRGLYRNLGDRFKTDFAGWRLSVLLGNPDLKPFLGLRAHRKHTLYNGDLRCELLHYRTETVVPKTPAQGRPAAVFSPEATMLANRLKKNMKTLGKWAARNGVTCYRLYDADIPEYAVAVDLYEKSVLVQEYAPPPTIDPDRARARLDEACRVVREVLGIAREDLYLKMRTRQKDHAQYERMADTGRWIEVHEAGAAFLVNMADYIDSGLYLDHRPTRELIGNLARDTDFLNLFGYTGTATVVAALGGARSTTTVDLSATYLSVAKNNMKRNGCTGNEHRFVQADCMEWLSDDRGTYGLIFLAPPTFSRSRRMRGTLDIQRDHVHLIRQCVHRLSPGGRILFTTHFRKFRINQEALVEASLSCKDITRETIPRDFLRNPRIHRSWLIERT